MLKSCIGLVVGIGWLIYFYFYQLWPQRTGSEERVRIPSDRVFQLFYRYLQLSTPLYAGWSLARAEPPWATTIMIDGLCICVLSILLFVWPMLSLRAQYSHCFDSCVPTALIAQGPYAFIRHPIYVANCLMLAGLFAATGSWGVALNAVILALFYYRAACREETALLVHLPGYRDYMRRTGRFLPRLHRLWQREQPAAVSR